MNEREHFIWKAKHQRGLSDEQINYFLERDTRYKLMPYYSLCCKRLGAEQGYNEVINQHGKAINRDKVIQLEMKALQKSETVCEECGASGTLRTDRTWIQTLCDQCAAKPSAETDQEDRVKNLFGQNQICDYATKALIDRPAELVYFYQELDGLCRKYGFSLAHEDEYGGFIIDDYKPENMTWLFDAAKRYDKKEEQR